MHPPLPARERRGPTQQIRCTIRFFCFLFHQLHRTSCSTIDLWPAFQISVSGFTAREGGCLKLPRITAFFDPSRKIKESYSDESRIFVSSCQRMVAMWREPLLIFIYIHQCTREGTRFFFFSSSPLLFFPSIRASKDEVDALYFNEDKEFRIDFFRIDSYRFN